MNYKEEICKQYPYRIELHAHNRPISTCGDFPAEDVLKMFKADGYDGIALTNHFMTTEGLSVEEHATWYRDELYKTFELADKIGIKLYTAAEIRFKSENNNDYLLYGYNPDDLLYICQLLQGTFADFIKNYKTDDMFLAQAHPFRKGLIPMDTDLLDGIEAFNMHPNHNSKIAIATQFAKEHKKTMIMGTDFHHPNHDNLCATRTKFLPENTAELVKLLKSEDYVFEISDRIII